MALDRTCVAHEQPTESTHCLDLRTRREEDQRAAEGNMEKNCRRRKAEDGFRHLERSCYCCKRPSRLEETSQRPYSPRGDIGNKSSKSIETPAPRALGHSGGLTRPNPGFNALLMVCRPRGAVDLTKCLSTGAVERRFNSTCDHRKRGQQRGFNTKD